jgi:hypothetical protein
MNVNVNGRSHFQVLTSQFVFMSSVQGSGSRFHVRCRQDALNGTRNAEPEHEHEPRTEHSEA